MITDLFSHKIHSSSDDWPEKLSELAIIFSEFDGEIYQRSLIEDRLRQISPRSSYAASYVRDLSKFRDEISAYPAYLGLYFLEPSREGWRLKLSETARKFLVTEEPDVSAFLRLQLTLFQYPNAMGAAYRSGTNTLRMQANARDRTLNIIRQGIHLSPLRLIVVALKADAELRGVDLLAGTVTYKEIYSLANNPDTNKSALPHINTVKHSLNALRSGGGYAPERFERRFHILRHLDLFKVGSGEISIRETVDERDQADLQEKLNAILQVDSQFNDFDYVTSEAQLTEIFMTGKWGYYFDGIHSLKSATANILSSSAETLVALIPSATPFVQTAAAYPLQERSLAISAPPPFDRRRDLADPEATRIKKQRRNLIHKELVAKVDGLLRKLGAIPKENSHIDLYADIPGDGAFLFEIKSGGENLLEQIRKGLSQLYEYRYRYKDQLEANVSLCLVIPHAPEALPWLQDYLCSDRQIGICWFDQAGKLSYPKDCAAILSELY